jgi:hypothetical protein
MTVEDRGNPQGSSFQRMALTPFVPRRYNPQWHFGPIRGQAMPEPKCAVESRSMRGEIAKHHSYK